MDDILKVMPHETEDECLLCVGKVRYAVNGNVSIKENTVLLYANLRVVYWEN